VDAASCRPFRLASIGSCSLQILLQWGVRAQVIDVWEPVTESDVQTPMEVYQELVEDGYNVVGAAACSSLQDTWLQACQGDVCSTAGRHACG
jgi:hypothetical protein